MKHRGYTIARMGLAVAGLLLLSGCATWKQQDLYHWGSFSDANYLWLKDNNADEGGDVIAAMEKNLSMATAKGQRLPPGFHAHLGLLYLQANQIDLTIFHWEAEKTAFPESIPFMDFQLRALQDTSANPTTDTDISETTQ